MKAKVTPCKGRSNRAFLLLPLQGATTSTRDTQGAASLALGYEEHWAFSPRLLNPKLESLKKDYEYSIKGAR
ncbi:hypothetical protein [uncultured Prevotellamassilia sp.]|uniref:hypothetical protein n=1 Tax=uncultured Prevotellamassilia sp. TaxID=1926676 RepID=UPI002587B8D5|nr:hypothetical protein [uncultured Prevotellamassilia sp.]